MSVIAVLRHLAFEDLGILETLFTQRGDTFFYVDAPVADLADSRLHNADLLVVLGAPVAVYDTRLYPFLLAEKHCIKQRLDSGKAVLGICLGAQLIADVLGANVAAGNKEIGFAPLTLTAAGRQSPLRHLHGVAVLHWHGDRFELPDGAVHLAATAVCDRQAFSVGDRVLGLQFHLEADPNAIEYWLVGHACELAAAGADIAQIRRDARTHGDALRQAADKTIGEWLARALPDNG